LLFLRNSHQQALSTSNSNIGFVGVTNLRYQKRCVKGERALLCWKRNHRISDLTIGWCAGCNPPSVLDGIHLNGLPAPPTASSVPICPFTPQDGRFNASTRPYSMIWHISSSRAGWTFRFCSGAKALALRFTALRPVQWAEFPQASSLESRPPAHQPSLNNNGSVQ